MGTDPQDIENAENPVAAILSGALTDLERGDLDALRQLSVLHRFVGRSHMLQRDEEDVTHIKVLCKGWAMRCRWFGDERRQVLDFALPGDLIGLELNGAGRSICDVIAVTPCEIGEISLPAWHRLISKHSGLASALNRCMAQQLTLANDQILRLGRMTAFERVSSFLLEIFVRQKGTALGNGIVDFPVTQTVVADLLGLSIVHVNRQVMRLRREGLVTLNRRQLAIHDVERLAALAHYRDRRFSARPSTFVAAE